MQFAQSAMDRIQHQIDMFDQAIKSIMEQQDKLRVILKEKKARYDIEKYELTRRQVHYKQLMVHKNMLHNQHNSVKNEAQNSSEPKDSK